MEKYWKEKRMKNVQKETWARWRCGNAIKEGKKGYVDNKCRACKKQIETLEHVIGCEEVVKKLQTQNANWLKKWKEENHHDNWRKEILKALAKDIDAKWCNYLNEVEEILKDNK